MYLPTLNNIPQSLAKNMNPILNNKILIKNYFLNFDFIIKLVLQWLKFRENRKEIKNKIINKICNYLDLDIILQDTVDQLQQLLNLDYCNFFVWDLSHQKVTVKTESFASHSYYSFQKSSQLENNSLANFGALNTFLENQNLPILNSQEFFTDQLNYEISGNKNQAIFDYNFYLLIPIYQDKNQIALIGCFSNQKRKWLTQEIKFIQELKQPLNIAISHGDLYQEISQIAKREKLVNYITHQTRSSLDLESILNNVIQEILPALEVDRCIIHLVEETSFDQDNLVRYQHLYEAVQKPFAPSIHYFDPHGPMTNWVIDHQESVVINDVRKDERIDKNNPEYRQAEIKSSLVIPVIYDNKIYAIIYLNQCSKQRNWSKSDQLLAKSIADQLAISIRQAHLYHQMEISALKSEAQAEKLEQTLEELKTTQIQLIQTEKMSSLTQMVAGISHELNNPVSFIYGNIPFLKEYITDVVKLLQTYQNQYPNPHFPIVEIEKDLELDFILEDISHILDSMKQGATRVKNIVNLLQSFSHLNEAPFKAINLHQSLDNALLILNHKIGNKIKIEKNYSDLPLVECYPKFLNQVFLGILNNAIQALFDSNKETKILTLSSQLIAPDRVEISIKDNGVGIPLEIQPKIFDPFFTTKKIGQGQGNGLTFCYQTIVNHHQGNLNFHSIPDQGTNFLIQLPIKQG